VNNRGTIAQKPLPGPLFPRHHGALVLYAKIILKSIQITARSATLKNSIIFEKKSMLIVGITGTLGAGKGTVVDYLVRKKDFVHFSVRGYLSGVLERRDMPVNRDTLMAVANELRAKHGPAHIIEQLYGQAREKGKSCIIESIRTPGEIASLRNNEGFVLLAVDADPRIRYNRIRKRNSETDNVSFSTFLQNEEREMHSDDPNKQNLAECIRQADHLIDNGGNREALGLQIECFYRKFVGPK
jgi:dephospho-CoA kinase